MRHTAHVRLHPRHRIDATATDVAFAMWACAGAFRRRRLAERAERTWSTAGDSVACLSARSGFDLLLSALDFPVGSEVLVSAVTIPDMVGSFGTTGWSPSRSTWTLPPSLPGSTSSSNCVSAAA